ncbi:MAG: thymidine phosphorylase, partial [Roseovarius gahaiensis]
VTAIQGEAMGLAVIALGGGRQVERDIINPAVGLDRVAPLGAYREKGDPLLRIHAATPEQADSATKALLTAITIADKAASVSPLILDRVPG